MEPEYLSFEQRNQPKPQLKDPNVYKTFEKIAKENPNLPLGQGNSYAEILEQLD